MERISELKELHAAAILRKAVVVPDSRCWRKPLPAMVLLHQQGMVLMRLFDMGMYIYEKKGKEKSNDRGNQDIGNRETR